MPRYSSLEIGCRFFPVGQGLFTWGSLQFKDQQGHKFHWVYDCGTTSGQSLVKWGIEQIAASSILKLPSGRPVLDLAIISHFDNDHISGIVSLIKTFSIKTLLLPYIPLSQRLLIAFIEGVDTQQRWIQFFLNPAEFLSNIPGGDIDRIVFVPPSGGESSGVVEIVSVVPPNADEQDFHWELKAVLGHVRPEDVFDTDAIKSSAEKRGVSVEFLLPGSSLSASGLWEFLPYNDADLAPQATPAFRKAVDQRRDTLLGADGKEKRRVALVALRDLYDRQFGKSSFLRNVISLMLYAGPTVKYDVDPWPHPWWDYGPHIIEYRRSGTLLTELYRNIWHYRPRRTGLLHTGDAFLDTKKRAAQFLQFLRKSRLQELNCLQVMHHGARSNWYPGLAEKLSPDVSVFCSDPEHRRFKHPHGEVVRDFLPYMPIQVDKKRGLSIWNRIWLPQNGE